MPRSCFAPIVAVLGLLFAPQLAPAGPIGWSFRADPDHSTFGSAIPLGQFQATGPDDVQRLVYGYADLPEGLTGVGQDSMTRVQIGVLSKQGYQLLPAPRADTVTANPLTWQMWLTDAASGEVAVASFRLSASLLTGGPDLSNSEVVLGGTGGGAFRLGRNDYAVRLSTGESESGVWVLADVTAAAAAATPEPGTLALAGLGLGAVALRRRVRRR